MAIPPRRTLLTEMALEQSQANYVRKVLGDSANAIEEKLAKIGASGNPMTRMQLESQRASIKAMLEQDFKNIEASIKAGKIDAAAAASAVTSQYENQLLKIVMDKGAMTRIARSEAQRAVNNLEASLKRIQGSSYNPLSQQVYKTKQLADGWIDDIVNRGLVSGWSAAELAKAVIPSISPNVSGGVSYAANRLARTEINNAYHAASYDRYMKSPIVQEIEWLLSASHPEDDICNDYAAQSPFKKNAVPAKPHPFCYCYIVPKLPSEEEFLEKMFAGEYGDEPFGAETANVIPSEDTIKAGMAAAERQRKIFEQQMYVNRGKRTEGYNEALGWSRDTYKARGSYIEMGNKDMNMLLRNPEAYAQADDFDEFFAEMFAKYIDDLTELISKNQIADDIVVARGLTVSEGFNPATLKVGDNLADPAFLSTTTNLDEALNFASGRGAGEEGWVFITRAPKGTNAVAGADYQNELIFKPGQMQKVIGIDAEKRIIYTEMV